MYNINIRVVFQTLLIVLITSSTFVRVFSHMTPLVFLGVFANSSILIKFIPRARTRKT